MQKASNAIMDATFSTISTDTEIVRVRYPVVKKLDMSKVKESLKAYDVASARSPSNVTSARDGNSAPSTPLFMPSPKSLRSSHAKHAVNRQSLTKDIIQSLSNNEASVASIAERYSTYLNSSDFKTVVLKDYSVRSFDNTLLLETIVQYDGRDVRVLAEGHDLPHQFADSLCEELLGCATSATLDQVLQFINTSEQDKHVCLVVMRTLALMGGGAEAVGMATSADSALTAALKAVCAGLSKVITRHCDLEIPTAKIAAVRGKPAPSVSRNCFCLPRKNLKSQLS